MKTPKTKITFKYKCFKDWIFTRKPFIPFNTLKEEYGFVETFNHKIEGYSTKVTLTFSNEEMVSLWMLTYPETGEIKTPSFKKIHTLPNES